MMISIAARNALFGRLEGYLPPARRLVGPRIQGPMRSAGSRSCCRDGGCLLA